VHLLLHDDGIFILVAGALGVSFCGGGFTLLLFFCVVDGGVEASSSASKWIASW
jgi:hypothetical protein